MFEDRVNTVAGKKIVQSHVAVSVPETDVRVRRSTVNKTLRSAINVGQTALNRSM